MQIPGLDIVVANAAQLSMEDQEQFRMIRRNGLGASDSSIVLGVNPFKDNTEDELIKQKISDTPTATEQKIGDMVNVRKGADLEPIILKKFEKAFGIKTVKPSAMYALTNYKFLTVNFDGIAMVDGVMIPVEVKFISTYGAKYYNFLKAIEPNTPLPEISVSTATSFKQYCEEQAKLIGIPVYYYTQIQQQILALDAPYAYLSTVNDKDWERYTWYVPRDQRVIDELIIRGGLLWAKIEGLKKCVR